MTDPQCRSLAPRVTNALRSQRSHNSAKHSPARGVATLWVILSLPVALCLLAAIVEGGSLLLARLQLINALEAAALAAVDEWGDQANALNGSNDAATRTAARARAVKLFEANTVAGQAWPGALGPNGAALDSDNQTCMGSVVILGEVTGAANDTFNAGTIVNDDYGVRAQATLSVNSVLASVLGMTFGPFSIHGEATARYDAGEPKLIRVVVFNCP